MNYYIQEFIKDVLSLVNDYNMKEDILTGKVSIGDFLSKSAYKGIDPQVVLKCIELNDLNYLCDLARKQNRINAYYDQWLEYFVLKQGPTYIQRRIDDELEHDNIQFIDDKEEVYSVTKKLVLIKK